MKRIIQAALALALFLPTVGHAQIEPRAVDQQCPIWLSIKDTSVTIAWFSPPDSVLPFEEIFSGVVSYCFPGNCDFAFLHYYGIQQSPLGEYHMWHTSFPQIPEPYTMEAFVRNWNGDTFDVRDSASDPECIINGTKLFVPIINK